MDLIPARFHQSLDFTTAFAAAHSILEHRSARGREWTRVLRKRGNRGGHGARCNAMVKVEDEDENETIIRRERVEGFG